MALFAIGWEPELRGLLTVIIGVVVLCGSIYLVLATNIGARLGFLVTLTSLAGWMMLMGMVWWIYGIGLRGPDPAWVEVPGATVLQDPAALRDSGAIETLPPVDEGALPDESAAVVGGTLTDEGYVKLPTGDPAFGQAQAAAAGFLEEEEAFGPGGYVITDVYDIGGERYPKINDSLDFVAFIHTPHYVVVEARPLIEVRNEPGRAPAQPEIDEAEQVQYVYMVRDLGARRQPATVLAIGGGAIFLALCYLLNRRDHFRRENLEAAAAVARAG
ncbi:MAG: hypothetical protein QNM02_19450 [Acidimicrobiia bacterium]|nr:hypothetical protein [Acidimicrobiia bacterium]